MKVSELIGTQLNYWVAKALGAPEPHVKVAGVPTYMLYDVPIELDENVEIESFFEPSSIWAHGGPIIESRRISIWSRPPSEYASNSYWSAKPYDDHPELYASRYAHVGTTPLEAAMRAVVASVYGEQVPDVGGIPRP